jgi:PAS domain S-box-containing protein
MKSKSELALPRDTFLLDLVQVAVVSLDARGHVSLINRKGCDLLGYGADEILGRNWFEHFLPESIRNETAEVFQRLMNDEVGGVEYFENPVLTRAGEERLIAWHNAILRNRAGKPTGTLSSGEDITDRKAAEEELRQSNRELLDLKTALDQAAIVAATDRRGIIDYVNDKFCEISKYSARELMGQDHRLINSGYHPKSFFRELWRTIQSGRIWRGEIRNRAKDGTHYWVDTTIVPFMDESGTPYRYMAIRSDITDRKLAEEELRKSEALARVGHMAAIVAHEVKNPLAGIGGAVQIIGERLPESSPDREVIGNILERIDALNRKVEDLLAFSRPKPPHFEQLPLHRSPATPTCCARSSSTCCSTRPRRWGKRAAGSACRWTSTARPAWSRWPMTVPASRARCGSVSSSRSTAPATTERGSGWRSPSGSSRTTAARYRCSAPETAERPSWSGFR